MHTAYSIQVRRGAAGIGLLVVLIALALGLWLMFGKTGPGGSSYMGNVRETQRDSQNLALAMQAKQIAVLVGEQEMSTKRYPESLDEIEGFDPSMLRDQWDQPFSMTLVRDGRSVDAIELRSPGPDGVAGTEDDIVHLEKLPF